MARTLSLTVPSGHLTLGNLLGAIRQWAADQRGSESLYGIADLHALTTEHDPATVRALTLERGYRNSPEMRLTEPATMTTPNT